ncbi:hypothetical protein H634G_00580 [Metarhizium anisopliae BRIP 53293]|uniref:Zinc/iron permease n=1 Tax=Metarhizium anisopliae BRIP 53293 TaxID=1291518 RepID=A0A0D9PD40_METAN|nr:hypothetical protein H634G_00580 [Metarhizium anisopliae BRIP 53293]KJK87141.1 hypothetical protein H633G_08994 [Metarhizium anisopliae BRIP 53284]
MHVSSSLARLALLGAATANNIYPRQTAAPSPTSAAAPQITAVTDCHLHGSEVFCLAGATEYLVHTTPTQTTDIPAQFTGCHSHGAETFCIAPNGDDVQVNVPGAGGDTHQGGDQHGSDSKDSGHQHCHFHAGVEHCVGGDESENAAPKCDTTPRDYNVGLRVGLLFVIMASSALGVFGPIFLHKVLPRRLSTIFTLLKQFGTGIIISTAFVHLFTHASLMFGNKCIGELGYEGTTAAILMAGIFLSFLVEYIGQRIVLAKTRSTALLTREKQAEALLSTEVVSILVMEAGILFHSLLIGLTLVVAGDSFFITLFIVILFHQVFEGLALGTRIATIGSSADVHLLPPAVNHSGRAVENDTDKSVNSPTEETADASSTFERPTLSMKKKLGLASLFAFVTPIGMAIGIGVLQKFNGNDRSTLLAIGTLDALSAGILVWTGVVEMWAADWMTGSHGHKAELADADMLTVGLGVFGLVAGMVLMSFLGKWA